MDIMTGWFISMALLFALVVLLNYDHRLKKKGNEHNERMDCLGIVLIVILGVIFTLFSIVTPIYHQEIVTYTNCSIVRTNGYITVIKDNKDNVALVSNLAPIYIAKDENIVLRQVKGVNLFNIPSFGEHYIDVVPSETNVEREE